MWHAFITYTFTRGPWLPWFQGARFLFFKWLRFVNFPLPEIFGKCDESCIPSSIPENTYVWGTALSKPVLQSCIWSHYFLRPPYFPSANITRHQAAPASFSRRGDSVAHTVRKLRGQTRLWATESSGSHRQRSSLFLCSSVGSVFRDVVSKRHQ